MNVRDRRSKRFCPVDNADRQSQVSEHGKTSGEDNGIGWTLNREESDPRIKLVVANHWVRGSLESSTVRVQQSYVSRARQLGREQATRSHPWAYGRHAGHRSIGIALVGLAGLRFGFRLGTGKRVGQSPVGPSLVQSVGIPTADSVMKQDKATNGGVIWEGVNHLPGSRFLLIHRPIPYPHQKSEWIPVTKKSLTQYIRY
jgi:hypothetical protein